MLLLTGFAPFGGRERNPSAEAAASAAAALAEDGRPARAVTLPVSFARAWDALAEAVAAAEAEGAPVTAVVALGQAAGRRAVTPERVAVNLADTEQPDEDGEAPRGEPIVVQGPTARADRLGVDRAVAALRTAGVPAAPSLSAGTFVCNALAYRLLGWAQQRRVPAGFVHLPLAPGQALEGTQPTLADDLQARAARVLGEVALAAARTG